MTVEATSEHGGGRADAPARRRGRPPRHDRRALLDHAAAVLIDHGLHGLTHASLARRAGIATASVQHHFPTAAVLRLDALEHKAQLELDELLVDVQAVADAWERVRLVIRDSISDEPRRQRTGWALWLEYYGAASHDTAVAERVRHTRTAWRSALAAIVERGERDRAFRPTHTAEECASILFALIDGFGIRLAAPGPDDDTDGIMTTIEAIAAGLLRPRAPR